MDKRKSISEIKTLIANSPSQELLQELVNDTRKGVQNLLIQYQKREDKKQVELKKFKQRFNYEQAFWQEGKQLVCGVDEVGRGPLAGPVVAAAVILPHDFGLIEVNDSKQLTGKTRERLYSQIINQSLSFSIGISDNYEIDTVNIYQAARIAMLRAVMGLSLKPQQLIIDAMEIDSPIEQLKLIKADSKSVSVAAASIVAKVWRDHLMNFYDRLYPQYDFKSNDGYGTRKHLDALNIYGVTPLHRRSFEPIKSNF
ncbi:ribonuclease HII [Liquorilactobacillus hordei]|uniref:Ribonuclease HII n=1 Tax=Liquorilactobacillus hordei DSM 19519 TaxID=1423759 RepID=A0A0R1MTG4_9LACO|nr:ribonuclease HII [Liquorilactobacillus hordei]KRL08218.1 ribonuclease HII [Liquorilactobacillus hordei DSM 19519]QYH52442.1 ribonuclease HII [Liquorilactobacillus hordei DSM 19519]